MTDAPYRIVIERPRALVRIDMSGFWTVEIAQRFIVEFIKALKDAVSPAGEVFLLLNQEKLEVQSMEVSDMLAKMAATASPKPVKVAIISVKAIVRMQGKRMKPDSVNGWFDTEAEGLAWLFSAQSTADLDVPRSSTA